MGMGMVVLIYRTGGGHGGGAVQKKCWLIKRNCRVYEQEVEFDQRTQADSNQQKSWSYPREKNRN